MDGRRRELHWLKYLGWAKEVGRLKEEVTGVNAQNN